jgi:glycosyltransferase involved in cell wall biosynthesis
VDPYDVDSIRAGIEGVLTDPTLCEELRAKGIARSLDFSWEASVARTREIYLEVGQGH